MGNYKQLDSIPILKQTVNNVDEFYFTDEEKANCINNHVTSVSQLDDSISQWLEPSASTVWLETWTFM